MIALGALAVLVQTAVRLTIPYLVAVAIDRAILAGDAAVLTWVALTYAGLIGVQYLCGVLQILAIARIGRHTIYAIAPSSSPSCSGFRSTSSNANAPADRGADDRRRRGRR